jgi:hypothetical protein
MIEKKSKVSLDFTDEIQVTPNPMACSLRKDNNVNY